VELAALPEEVAVLTDRSALPLSLTERMVGAVCATVPGAYGEPIAAILIRADRPKSFIRRARSLLGLVATKVRERLERTLVHGKALEEPGLNGAATETLSPDSLGRLCNGMSLPMYVRDANGRYLTVNDAFLHRFEYESLESLNQRGNLFVDDDSWHRELSRIANNAGPSGTRNQIRTGSGKIRQVQEHATLVGRHLLAVLFDVSEFHSINEELQVALGEQKTLNERLTATTTMLQKTQATAIKALAKLAEYRDKETGNHLQRICNYMKLIGNRVQRMQPYDFEISEEYVHDLVLSGMLHDIGKVAIPDTILLKQGKLDSSEWTVMRKHPELGWSILNQADRELGEQSFLTLASRIALYHHERFDGAGYPYGITGESIPLSARIAAISDVYDALTSERPYKPAWTHEEAVAEIRQERGHHFDPVLVDIFLELQKEIIEVQSTYSEDPAIVN
jgi:response regulator RpfG family c-di-GMP phosphodiesterase